ncbi:pitrilysin family protein [uncultured Roseibium sp.]|uniref:M16 family metallopeptidase n=1 Tax=uncultured Roseibium sp. TaxID=1936171 RepID=UPI003217F05E
MRALFEKSLGVLTAGCLSLFAASLVVLPVQAVEIQKVISPGGIEAWLVEDHTIPQIAVNFSFKGGAAQDPKGKEGLTRLLAATMDEGAGDLPSQAFQARLEELAVNISFDTGKDQFYGNLRTLTPTRDEAFDLLHLALTKPRFDTEAVERMKAQLISSAKRNAEDPNAIAALSFTEAALGDHPYARPTGGTPESLETLSPEDLVEHHKRLVARPGLTIGVVGAIDAKTLAPLLDRVFAGLPEDSDLSPVPEATPKTGLTISKSLQVPQTTLMFGLPGLKRDDPDYQAAYVMNHILGGGSFTSWLYEEVREKRGLAYGVNTSVIPYDHMGLILGSTATRADRADETLKIVLEQVDRMATQGPTQAELDSAKRYLTGSYALRFDSSGKIASQLVALQNAGLGIDYFDRRNSEIEAVTLEDVNRVAQRLLAGKEPTVVSVGPATD